MSLSNVCFSRFLSFNLKIKYQQHGEWAWILKTKTLQFNFSHPSWFLYTLEQSPQSGFNNTLMTAVVVSTQTHPEQWHEIKLILIEVICCGSRQKNERFYTRASCCCCCCKEMINTVIILLLYGSCWEGKRKKKSKYWESWH